MLKKLIAINSNTNTNSALVEMQFYQALDGYTTENEIPNVKFLTMPQSDDQKKMEEMVSMSTLSLLNTESRYGRAQSTVFTIFDCDDKKLADDKIWVAKLQSGIWLICPQNAQFFQSFYKDILSLFEYENKDKLPDSPQFVFQARVVAKFMESFDENLVLEEISMPIIVSN